MITTGLSQINTLQTSVGGEDDVDLWEMSSVQIQEEQVEHDLPYINAYRPPILCHVKLILEYVPTHVIDTGTHFSVLSTGFSMGYFWEFLTLVFGWCLTKWRYFPIIFQ